MRTLGWALIGCLVLVSPVFAENFVGDFPTSATVRCYYNTNGQDGASITRSTDGTLKIYKNGSITERTSLSGVTQTEDFDGATGVHLVSIDTTDNTDAGFWAAGGEYAVVNTGMVIDTKTVNAHICSFALQRSGAAVALLRGGPTIMPEASYIKGATSVIHEIFIRDTSTNLGKTGLTNGSAGLTIAFGRADQGAAAYTTCAVQAATRGSYTSCGFVEKDATNAPGWYELGLTTTMLATGADYVTVSVFGVTGTVPTQLPIALVDFGLAAIYNRQGAPAGASQSADIAAVQTSATAIKAKTDSLGFTGSNVNAITNAYASGQTPTQPTVAGRTIDVASTGVVTSGATWRKNVAGQQKFPVFMRDSLVPATPKTGLTLTVQVWKDTGSFGTATGTAEEIGNGWYAFSPSQADTNCNLCVFSVTATGAIPTGYTINTAP